MLCKWSPPANSPMLGLRPSEWVRRPAFHGQSFDLRLRARGSSEEARSIVHRAFVSGPPEDVLRVEPTNVHHDCTRRGEAFLYLRLRLCLDHIRYRSRNWIPSSSPIVFSQPCAFVVAGGTAPVTLWTRDCPRASVPCYHFRIVAASEFLLHANLLSLRLNAGSYSNPTSFRWY